MAVVVLPLCREAVSVFCRPRRQGHSLKKSYSTAEKQLVYSAAPANWATHWRSLTPLQRSSWCILQPQPIGPLIEGVLLLCREAFGVFCSPSQLGHSLKESYSSAVKQLVYSAAPANWATHWRSLTPLQWSSWCILQPQPIGPLIDGVLLLCREAVGVFCSPSQLGHSLKESYSSAEKQLVYSAAPANWATHWRSLTPLQRSSWCILQPQLTGQGVVKRKHGRIHEEWTTKRLRKWRDEDHLTNIRK